MNGADATRDERAGTPIAGRIEPRGPVGILDLLPEFETHMRSDNPVDQHVEDTLTRIRLMVKGAGWRSVHDITAASAKRWLVRESTRLARRTLNHYRASIFQFCEWCVQMEYLEANPIRAVKKWRVGTESTRACPTKDQVARFIVATAAKPVQKKDRWIRYLLEAAVGIRPSTIRALRCDWFILDEGLPRIVIPARAMKNRKPATIYLTAECARWMRWLREQRGASWAPGLRAIQSIGKPDSFNADLRAAGIPKVDPTTGQAFTSHSLRHFCNMYLESASALDVAERQAQMTHESKGMTTRTYFHKEHELRGQKIYNLQPILPNGFAPPPPNLPPDFPKSRWTKGGDSVDTSGTADSTSQTRPRSQNQSDPPVPLASNQQFERRASEAREGEPFCGSAGPQAAGAEIRVAGSNPVTLTCAKSCLSARPLKCVSILQSGLPLRTRSSIDFPVTRPNRPTHADSRQDLNQV